MTRGGKRGKRGRKKGLPPFWEKGEGGARGRRSPRPGLAGGPYAMPGGGEQGGMGAARAAGGATRARARERGGAPRHRQKRGAGQSGGRRERGESAGGGRGAEGDSPITGRQKDFYGELFWGRFGEGIELT